MLNEIKTENRIEAENSAINENYVRSPNNIYGINGSEWYPGCGGLPEIRHALVFINDGCTDAEKGRYPMPQDKYPVALYYHIYGKPCTLSLGMRFATFTDFLKYAEEHGKPSQPGMPAGIFGD